MYNEILVSIENKIATIALNRPESSNPLTKDASAEVTAAFEECGANDAVSTIVLTGLGKNFSAGGDIKRFKQLIETKEFLPVKNLEMALKMALTIHECPKPTIAMVNGAAAGAGCSIALACDFRFVTESSKFIMAFIKLGLSGDTAGMYFLQKLVGIGKTKEMMLTGVPVSGEEAVRIGMATKQAEEGKLEEVTYGFAKLMARSPLHAIKRQKELLREYFYPELSAYSAKEALYMSECSQSKEFEEAVNAFLEKRPANF